MSFQLYKIRNFNDLINDTFAFFKEEGKNYFRNYFIINGILLLVLVILMFFVGRVFFENFLNGVNSPGRNDSEVFFAQFFGENIGFFVGTGIAGILLILLISLISYSYPVVYLIFTEQKIVPDNIQVRALLLRKTSKAILFGLLSLVTFLPLAIILGLLSILLFVTIILIPVAIGLFAAFSCWATLSFYDYLSTNNGFFSAMGNGWRLLFKNFWVNIGATSVLYIILYVIQGIISMIIYTIGTFVFIVDTDTSSPDPTAMMGTLGVLMMIVFLVSTVFSYFITNLLMVNQGLIYYSGREQEENKATYSEIDLIGNDFETED